MKRIAILLKPFFINQDKVALGLHSLMAMFASFAVCIASCVSRPSLGVDPGMLLSLEAAYQKVFVLENQYNLPDVKAFISFADKMAGGADLEGDVPYWFSEQNTLIHLLNQIHLDETGQRRIRMHLMKKFGVVSSFINMPRGVGVKTFISIPDRFGFEYAALGKTFEGHVPPNSKLLESMLAMPDAYR
ncbi:hypothetical protein [Prosthecobacter sp.]|uniref:hypothetical protein n=1 Tax=Prosthecobacter sp. TaxID=1965333 RepID=UPI003784163D